MTEQISLSDARSILDSFSSTQTKLAKSEAEKEQLRQALSLVVELAEGENLGVCADNGEQGYRALRQYLQALGYDISFAAVDLAATPAPIYIKFNCQKLSHFCDSYTGDYRGVLVSCQSEDDRVNGTYGHLPLDLFE